MLKEKYRLSIIIVATFVCTTMISAKIMTGSKSLPVTEDKGISSMMAGQPQSVAIPVDKAPKSAQTPCAATDSLVTQDNRRCAPKGSLCGNGTPYRCCGTIIPQ